MQVNPVGKNENGASPRIKPAKSESLPKPQPLAEASQRRINATWRRSPLASPSVVRRILGINPEWELLQPEELKQAKKIYKALYLEGLPQGERKNLAAKIVRGSQLPQSYSRQGGEILCPGGRKLLLHAASGGVEVKLTKADLRAKALALTSLVFKDTGKPMIEKEAAGELVDFIENQLKVSPELYLKGEESVYLRREDTKLPDSLLVGRKKTGGLKVIIMAKEGPIEGKKELGRGTSKRGRIAIDYEAGDERKPRFVASLTLDPKPPESPQQRPIRDELRLIEQTLGRTIYSVIYSAKNSGDMKLNFILPLASEGELYDLVDEEKIWYANDPDTIQLRKTITLSLMDIAARMHENGIANRDLKLENLLINKDKQGKPEVWITDLGFATTLETEGAGVGSPEYVPPDLFDLPGFRGTAGQHDVYSMGVILWKLFNPAEPVFVQVGGTPDAIDFDHWMATPPWIDRVMVKTTQGAPINANLSKYEPSWEGFKRDNPNLDPLTKLILKATHHDPDKRPSMTELAKAVQALPDDAFIAAPVYGESA